MHIPLNFPNICIPEKFSNSNIPPPSFLLRSTRFPRETTLFFVFKAVTL